MTLSHYDIFFGELCAFGSDGLHGGAETLLLEVAVLTHFLRIGEKRELKYFS